jgi:flagellar assembly protein FliH
MPLQTTNTVARGSTPVSTGVVAFDAPTLARPVAGEQRSEFENRISDELERGYADGYAHGLRRAEDEVAEMIDHHRRARDELVEAGRALQQAASSLAARRVQTVDDLQHDVLELAMVLAEEIVGRELSTASPVRDSLRRALELLPVDGAAAVRVHPADAGLVEAHLADDPHWHGSVEVVADPGIERGGCVLTADECRIDAQLGAVIERVRGALH